MDFKTWTSSITSVDSFSSTTTLLEDDEVMNDDEVRELTIQANIAYIEKANRIYQNILKPPAFSFSSLSVLPTTVSVSILPTVTVARIDAASISPFLVRWPLAST